MSNDSQSFEEDHYLRRWSNGVNTQDVTNRHIYTWTDSRIGTELSNWRSLVRQGLNATTPYACIFQEFKNANVVVFAQATKKIGGDFDEHTIGGRLSSAWGVVGNPSSYSTSVADRSARDGFVQQYRSRRTTLQGGVFLGELAETVKMISNPAKALRQGIDRYYQDVKKRLKRSKPRTKPRILRDTWLEYVYGWSPLIGDVRDIAKLATADPLRVLLPLKFSAREVIEVDSDRASLPGNGLAVSLGTIRTVGWVEVAYKGAVKAENTPPSFPEQLGLSWSNFLPTVWELIPYSFLVDYFTNVGNVIDGISSGSINLAWGCCNTWKKLEQSLVAVEFDRDRAVSNFGLTYKDITGYATGGGTLGLRSTYNRAVANSVSFGIRDASFRLPGSGTRWLNIAALARLRK